MEILTCDAEKIVVAADRVRREFNKEKLQKLATSYKRIGQLQAGICVRSEDGSYQLVAGERRLRACRIAKIPFSFVLSSTATADMLLEIELEENLCRENLSWQEEVDGLDRLHRHRETQKEQKGQTQSLDDTAIEIESSRTSVHRDLELAEWAKEFQEVKDAPSKAEAFKIIKRFKAELVRNQLLKQAVEKSETRIEITGEEGELVEDSLIIAGTSIPKELLLDFDRRVIQGRMEEELNRFEDGSLNLVLFDPPWGVNLIAVSNLKGDKSTFEDSWKMFFTHIELWLQLIYKKMATDSHLYMFFGIANEGKEEEIPIEQESLFLGPVYGALEKVGFQTNRIPLIWYKQSAHVTRNPEIWPGRSYEPIAFARKGNKKLITLGSPDVIITPAPTMAIKGSHPAAKHPDVYLELLKRSAYPGDLVLDPMAGSGMVGVAAEAYRASKRLDWWLIEEKQEFRELALENVIRGYSKVVNREPIERPPQIADYEPEPLPEDFHELEPGGSDWIRFWKVHPEAQGQMLEWQKSKREGEGMI